MIWLAAVMIARTAAGAPFGTAARPLRRIMAVWPGTLGVFATGSAGMLDHGLLFVSPPSLIGVGGVAGIGATGAGEPTVPVGAEPPEGPFQLGSPPWYWGV